jgi:Mg-chelatase subunit ChlD
MGGDYYDRDVNIAESSVGYSNQAASVMSRTSMHYSMDPKNFVSLDLESTKMNPIVFALDVTGSMGDWSKVTLYIN